MKLLKIFWLVSTVLPAVSLMAQPILVENGCKFLFKDSRSYQIIAKSLVDVSDSFSIQSLRKIKNISHYGIFEWGGALHIPENATYEIQISSNKIAHVYMAGYRTLTLTGFKLIPVVSTQRGFNSRKRIKLKAGYYPISFAVWNQDDNPTAVYLTTIDKPQWRKRLSPQMLYRYTPVNE